MNDQNENIKCVVRIRPLIESEKKINEICIRKSPEDSPIIVVESKPKNQVKQFSFDQVFDEKTKQEEIFNILCNPLLEAFFQGYNCTIFAYGQTGSGKTHTMLGQLSSIFNNNDNSNHGLIPRILNSIFSRIEDIKKDNFKENKDVSIIHTATIKCSCLELYQEQFIDLLNENNSENLIIREDIKKGMYVEGVMEKDIDSVRSALELILLGLKNRHIAATNMNPESSRSHLIFTIFLTLSTQVEGGLVKTKNSRLHLIDLAGSERQKSTGTIGERLKEAGMINKSLSTLGNVINALVENNNAEGKGKYVPFRDSKLTFFLKDSLGGNSKTTIVANISPCIINIQETLSTLKFVQRAKQIKNKAIINENVSGTLKSLQEEIKKLKDELDKVSQGQCKNCMRKSNMFLISTNSNFISPSVSNKTLETSYDDTKISLFKKDEIKELCSKIESLLNYEKTLNEKLINMGKLSKVFQEINSIRNIYKKESQQMFDDLEKKMNQIDQIFKSKESFLNEFKNKNSDNKALCGKLDKLLSEMTTFKSSLVENNYETYKLGLENKAYKNDLDQLKKQRSNEFLFIFNKQNIDIISSILNEFVETNTQLQTYYKDHIEIFIKDKNIENLLFQVDELKMNEDNMRKTIEDLQNENFLLNMEIQKYKESNHPKFDNEKYFALEKKVQKLNLNLNEKILELKEKCNENDTMFLEFQELKSKIANFENIISNNEGTILQQKDDIEILIEGNKIFENNIITLNEKIEKKDRIIQNLLEEINHIQILNKSNLEKNNLITSEVNEIIIGCGQSLNYSNTLMKEIETLYKNNSVLEKVNAENKKDILALSNSFSENCFKQNTFFFEKDSFDDCVYKSYKKLSKSYSEMIISFKSNFSKLIEFYNNSKKSEKIIKVNVMNYMKFFDGKIEQFYKNFERKYSKQLHKINLLKQILLEKKFSFICKNDFFNCLKEEVSQFVDLKDEINLKIKQLSLSSSSSNTQVFPKLGSNVSLTPPSQIKIKSSINISSDLIPFKKEESKLNYKLKENESKIQQLLEDKKRLEDNLAFLTKENEKVIESQVNQKIKIMMKYKDENYNLRSELNELKRKLEFIEKKLKGENIELYQEMKLYTNESLSQLKNQYDELTNKLFKIKVNTKESKFEHKHDRAINLIKYLEAYFDVQDAKLTKNTRLLNKNVSVGIQEEAKKNKQNFNNNISSDNVLNAIQKNKARLERNANLSRNSRPNLPLCTKKTTQCNEPNNSFT